MGLLFHWRHGVLRWGEPRLTEDVELCLLTGFGKEDVFLDELLQSYSSRISDAKTFAIQNRVLLLKSSRGAQIDISLGAMPFEDQMIERASEFRFDEGCVLKTCSSEDLIVMKAFADRDEDWMDLRGILDRQRSSIDFQYVRDCLGPLCELKGAPEIAERFEQMVRER
ncbi:MAG: hypothetical protein O3B01_15640 [Planctomycetota bacterium]|nr:hypothetical protein [Planctomycetota bacterium]MDA1140008.1 hypothetical protein [Planctomycetota bacterium]